MPDLRILWSMPRHLVCATALAVASLAQAQAASPAAQETAIVARATELGATDVTVQTLPDGGQLLGGRLEGAQFAIAIPKAWAHEAVVYAHGYTLPGMPVAVAANPAGNDAPIVLQAAYRAGFAAAHSAYDKAGMGVQTGAGNSLRLRDLLAGLEASDIYIAGFSMGGNIVMSLVEDHPDAFAGALAGCGVTDGWESQMGPLFDMRAAYNVLTEGTPYALPGVKDVTTSALPMTPPADYAGPTLAYVQQQMARVAMPVLALWGAAAKAPDGPEARIVRQLVAIGGFPEDVASLVLPLAIIALGADDMKGTFGGQIYGNRTKVYNPVGMTSEQAKAFNASIQRFDADAAAIAAARRWHQVNGRLKHPLIAVHNRLDPLVPYRNADALRRLVEAHGSSQWLAQFTLPDMREPLPLGGLDGLAHCGFTVEQMSQSLSALREWVKTGTRPSASAVE